MQERSQEMKRTSADDRLWKVQGGRPSTEALVRASLVLLGRPPVIRPEVLEELRRDREERARAEEAEKTSRDMAVGVISLCPCGDKDCRRHLS